MAEQDNQLYSHPLYTTRAEFLDRQQQVELAYARARLVCKTWNLSLEDVLQCSEKFWELHADPILTRDAGCANILAGHINLFIGTLAPYARKHPELGSLLQRALDFDIVGGFLLTEVDHGLDMFNLETIATKVEDGFILHTPHLGAAKFMPPTTPIPGITKFAIVMAKLIVKDQDCGVHPFIVPISDGLQMYQGVKSAILPPRSGSSPLDYSITTFSHVKLPISAFLGDDLVPPSNRQAALDKAIWRVRIGTLSIAGWCMASVGLVAYIGSVYSQRRCVRGKSAQMLPIIQFRTQQLPIMHALAGAYVLKAWLPHAIATFMDASLPMPTRHAMAAIYKATAFRLVIGYAREVGERLGAQGTFNHNLVSQIEMDARGGAIAEGDILVLCIRLFTELLLERYEAPRLNNLETSRLAHQYQKTFSRCRERMQSFPQGHRDPGFNEHILPLTQDAVLMLGKALALEVASEVGVPQPLLTLFEIQALRGGPSSRSLNLELDLNLNLEKEEAEAINALLPRLDELTNGLNVDAYITAPICSDAAWMAWMRQQKVYEGCPDSDTQYYQL